MDGKKNAMMKGYSNEKKQWEPLPKPLLGAIYITNVLAAPNARTIL